MVIIWCPPEMSNFEVILLTLVSSDVLVMYHIDTGTVCRYPYDTYIGV
jgi:hypothetical protein